MVSRVTEQRNTYIVLLFFTDECFAKNKIPNAFVMFSSDFSFTKAAIATKKNIRKVAISPFDIIAF